MSGAPIDHAIAERAVQWLMDLQAPTVSQKTRVEFARWRAQSQEHERAWQRIEAFQQRFADLQQSHTAPVAHATLAARPNRRQALKALALLVAGGAAWSARDNRLVQDWTADYYTHIGEQRQLTLSDGTRLALNTDSAVDVRFDAGQRRLMLLRGEVMISTGKDPRPLFVDTAQGRVRPIGTRFTLRQAGGSCRVAVWEGAVALQPRSAAGGETVVNAGEQALLTDDDVSALRPAQPADNTWTDATLVASDQRLSDFLAELSRYRPGRLGCTDNVANIRVSGTFPLGDTDRILDTLAATLGVRVRYYTPYWVTVGRG